VSAGRARPPHGTFRIGVEKVPAQQIVYLRFNLQLRWSGHAAALYHRGDRGREWNAYNSYIINRPVWYKNCTVYLDDASLMWLGCVALEGTLFVFTVQLQTKYYKVSLNTTFALKESSNTTKCVKTTP